MSDREPPKPSLFVRIGQWFRRTFVAGIVVCLPVILTWYIVLWLFNFVDGLLGRYINAYLMDHYGYDIPGLGLGLTVVLIVLLGAIVSSTRMAQRFYGAVERELMRLPLIRNIYPSVRQITNFFFGTGGTAFRKVVLVEYPSAGIWQIGFITNEDPGAISNSLGGDMYAILVPIPPSPFTGPTVFLPKDQVKFLDITVEAGLKLVMSGGVLIPERLEHATAPEEGGSPS
jgi:uncharacterized membrane protein